MTTEMKALPLGYKIDGKLSQMLNSDCILLFC